MNALPYKFLSVDLQKDFTHKGGAHFKHRPSVAFIQDILVPFLLEQDIQIAEIISDYRQPRPGRKGDFCKPGTKGYEPAIPETIKRSSTWVKSANSPLWTRENAGREDAAPGVPYEDPVAFGEWSAKAFGEPDQSNIVLIGLTLDRCVLCTAQELYMRGYKVSILLEAVDTFSGNQTEKEAMLNGQIINNFSSPISWNQLRAALMGWPQNC